VESPDALFAADERATLLDRVRSLKNDSVRQWGKMNPAQMLAHLSAALETPTGDRPMKQAFLGRIITPLIRSSVLGEKPFGRNSPTDPTFVIANERDFEKERARLLALVQRFVERGPEAAGSATHAFFGKLSGDEWARLMYKHIDHHLRQFGA
jgi:hypothetical protein